MAPKKNGISWITGTRPTVKVTLGFGVKPACAIVRPVVRFAIVAKSDEARTMMITAPNRSPTSPGLEVALRTLVRFVWKNPV